MSVKTEDYNSFIQYTLEKLDKYFENVDLYELSCICDLEYDIMLMFIDFPSSITLENLVKINENLDKNLLCGFRKQGK